MTNMLFQFHRRHFHSHILWNLIHVYRDLILIPVCVQFTLRPMDLLLQIKVHLIHKKEIMIVFFLLFIVKVYYTFACANVFTGLNLYSQMSYVAHEPPVLSPSMLHIIIALCKCGY